MLQCGGCCCFSIAVAGVMMGAVAILVAVVMAFAFDGIEEDDDG